MGILNRIVTSSAKYKALESQAVQLKTELKTLKASYGERKRKHQAALEAIAENTPRLYPQPRVLIARPTAGAIAGRLLELTGQVLAAKLARRIVYVDWRDGALDVSGSNAFWSLFLPSLDLLRGDLADVENLYFTRTAERLPAPDQVPAEQLAEWLRLFHYDREQENQVLISYGDPWWRERFPETWLRELANEGRLAIRQLEMMQLRSLFRPRLAIRRRVEEHLAGLDLHCGLGVHAPAGAPIPDLVATTTRLLGETGRDFAWLLAESEETRAAFDQALGPAVRHLRPAPAETPLRQASAQLAALYALSHSTRLLLGAPTEEARLIELLSGLREADIQTLIH
jgi:hypothetical protein